MQETTMLRRRKADWGGVDGVLLDIDFEDSVVGERDIFDKVTQTQLTMLYSNAGTGVVDHPEYGKCYYADGNSLFSIPNPVLDFNINTENLYIQYRVAAGTNRLMQLIETGNYTGGFLHAGFSIAFNQRSEGYAHVFLMKDKWTFAWAWLPGQNPNKLETIRLEVTDEIRFRSDLHENTQSFNINLYGGNGHNDMCIMGTRGANYGYSGYLKYIKIWKESK